MRTLLPSKADSEACPGCGSKGKAIKPITIESLVIEAERNRIDRSDGFRFCTEPSCEVAYFHPETGARIAKGEVRVRIGQKETESPRPVCYCFGHTVEEIAGEVAATGTSKIASDISARCRQGLDRCEETNPQGSCCLGNVRRAVKDAQASFHGAEKARSPTDRGLVLLQDGLLGALHCAPEVSRAAVQLYRMLARGGPVALEDLASSLGISTRDAREAVAAYPAAAAEYDEAGRVISFGGLTLLPTAHRLEIEARVLHTWCALDALFLPRLLGKIARVQSTCPVSGRRVELEVAPGEVHAREPDRVFLSIPVPEPYRFQEDVRRNFCCHVHFLASEKAASAWLSDNEGSAVISLEDGFTVARAIADEIAAACPSASGSTGDRTEEPMACCTVGGSHEKAPHDAARRKLGLWAATGAVASAILSSACCWLPLLLIAFGASAAGISGFFEAYRPYLLGATGPLLAGGFYLAYFRKEKCAPGVACVLPKSRLQRLNRITLWVAAVVVLAFALFPSYVGFLLGRADSPPVAGAPVSGDSRVFQVEGMTCKACAVTLREQLRRVPGVARADVSFEEKRARVFLAEGQTPPSDEALLGAIREAGYRGTPTQAER